MECKLCKYFSIRDDIGDGQLKSRILDMMEVNFHKPEQKIPKMLHFIWIQKNLLTEVPLSEKEKRNAKNIRNIIKMNPEYKVNFHDDRSCKIECNRTGIKGLVHLYESLRSHRFAYMADVCRWLFL